MKQVLFLLMSLCLFGAAFAADNEEQGEQKIPEKEIVDDAAENGSSGVSNAPSLADLQVSYRQVFAAYEEALQAGDEQGIQLRLSALVVQRIAIYQSMLLEDSNHVMWGNLLLLELMMDIRSLMLMAAPAVGFTLLKDILKDSWAPQSSTNLTGVMFEGILLLLKHMKVTNDAELQGLEAFLKEELKQSTAKDLAELLKLAFEIYQNVTKSIPQLNQLLFRRYRESILSTFFLMQQMPCEMRDRTQNTFLHHAIGSGYVFLIEKFLKRLLQQGGFKAIKNLLSAQNIGASTIFHEAASTGKIEVIIGLLDWLLARGGAGWDIIKKLVLPTETGGENSFHVAAICDNIKVIIAVLEWLLAKEVVDWATLKKLLLGRNSDDETVVSALSKKQSKGLRNFLKIRGIDLERLSELPIEEEVLPVQNHGRNATVPRQNDDDEAYPGWGSLGLSLFFLTGECDSLN